MTSRLSSKVLQLRFMQRAVDKEKRETEADAKKKETNDVRIPLLQDFHDIGNAHSMNSWEYSPFNYLCQPLSLFGTGAMGNRRRQDSVCSPYGG